MWVHSRLFLSKSALQHLQPYINRNKVRPEFRKFPLYFANNKYEPKDIKFISSYMVPKLYQQFFITILQRCSNLQISQDIQKMIPSFSPQESIQPKLLYKLKQYKSQKKKKLVIKNLQFKSSRILEQNKIKGVFMHRQLNMPAACYSFEEKNGGQVVIRMRRKFTKQEHIKIFDQKQALYEGYQRYYLDSYQNFIQNQYVKRQLVQISTEIQGEIYDRQNKQVIKLPISQSKISTHILQVENILIPGSNQSETTIVSDIDYFMKGNPYIL